MAVGGCLLVGIGVGKLLGDIVAGTLIGLGVGLVLEAIFGFANPRWWKRKDAGRESPLG